MLRRRSFVLGLALTALAVSRVGAQTTQPWTGIAANEARPALGNPGENESMSRSMSADGRFVVFDSNIEGLAYGDYNGQNDVLLRDRQTGQLQIVSVASDGATANSMSAFATISKNGRHIAFWSCATNFDPADTNAVCDLYIHDRELGTTVRGSLGPNGEQATITTQHYFSLSADGRYFAFNANFDGDYNRKIYLRDRDTDQNGVFDEPGGAATTLISQELVGSESLWSFEEVAISGDGRFIAYNASASDANYNFIGTRLFLHDRVTGNTGRVDTPMAGIVSTPAYSGSPDFSDAGHLAYVSNENNLAEGDTDGLEDVYVFNIFSGGNVPIELSHDGAPALDFEWSPAISADGRYVAFTGVMSGDWWNDAYNVFVVDRQTGLSYPISVRPDGSLDNGAGPPSISADGSSIAFSAGAAMLPNAWGPTGIFVAAGVALSPSEIEIAPEGGPFTIEVTMPAGVAWTLDTLGAAGVDFSQTSGAGPATIEVIVGQNYQDTPRELFVYLGTEQVVIRQGVRPIVYFVYPYESGPEGGAPIEIYGNAFVEGATVTIDGVPATDVVVHDEYTISATAPAHAGLGWFDVTVTNPDGLSGTLEFAFLYRDMTPPVVTYEIGGTLGANGWYTSNVSVNWNWEDPDSQTFITWCENPYQQLTDTASTISICVIWSDGGETFAEAEIKRDTVAPLLALSPSTPETYFQGQVVPIAHYCDDDTSGIASCTLSQAGPNLDTSATGVFELSLTAVDMAGHTTTTSTTYTVKMATALDVQPATTTYGAPAALSATLLGTGAPLAGKTITFFVDGVAAGTAVTSTNGTAVLNLPAEGRNAGTFQLWARFAGDDSALSAMSNGTDLIVEKITPAITWAAPATIVQGTPLSATQLNATSSVEGAFGYTPDDGTVLAPGTHTLTVQFAPLDATNYNLTSKTVTLKVKAVPVITWATPSPISYPYGVGVAQLNATANVPGTFVYSPSSGWQLPVGTHTLSVTFTPTNSLDYTTTTASVPLEVLKGTPDVTWNIDTGIYYGTPLGATQLNATSPLPGTFVYDPPAGTVLPAGTHTLTVLFTPASADWNARLVSRSLIVGKSSPAVLWDTPAPIQWGTPLGPQQQNATVYNNIPGTLTYSPAPGAVLEIGQHWMSVVFHPTDSANYDTSGTYVSLTVTHAQSVVNWGNPAAITYPQSLQNAQLNATANVAGAFTYTPGFGTILPAGTHTLHVSFNPADPHYWGAGKDVTIVVGKRTPAITWNPGGITYGTALSSAQLNATSNVAGTFSYSPALGTLLSAGTHTLSVTFTPNDAANYTTATGAVSINVAKATPIVAWSNPAGIVHGTALAATQLNATANVAGTFEYSPAAGAILNAGTQPLSVTFTPEDAVNYTTAVGSASINVTQAAPVVSWADPAGLSYGNNLTTTQLNATANVPGTFVYSPPHSTILNAGTHQLSVTFTPSDAVNYAAATATVTLIVGKVTPPVAFSTSSAITYGTALGAAQLNASAYGMPGTFTFTPPAGTVLNAGTHELSVTFVPADSTNYNSVVKTASLEVLKATPVLTWPAPGGVNYGTPLSATQLNATASVPGTFVYSQPAGTVLGAGINPLSVTFTPTDTANYTTSFQPRTITVAKMPLSLAVDNTTKVYGQALPAFTLSGTGFVNGEDVSSLNGTLTFSTFATATSAPGAYGVWTNQGLSSGNYNITYTDGTLTVGKASTSVTMTTTPNPSNNNQVVQLRAVVSVVAPGAGTPTGTVEFREGSTLLGTATLVNGVATMNKSFKKGTHSLTATYVASTNYNGSSGGVAHQVP
jgi:hypothetical protein